MVQNNNIQITNVNTSPNINPSFVKLCIDGTERDEVPLKTLTGAIIDFRINNELLPEMSVTEFAKEARISRQAVVKMISGGRLRAKKVGEQYIIDSGELIRYLKTK
jgi:excisionase family DNA binding protein